MSCSSESITNENVQMILHELSSQGYKVFQKSIGENKHFVTVTLDMTLELIFILTPDVPEIFLHRNIGKKEINYFDDETQIDAKSSSGRKSILENVKTRGEEEITFNEYKSYGDYWNRTRSERNRAHSDEEILIGRGKSMKFNTRLLPIDFYRYTQIPCLLEYFERNDFVRKTQGPSL